MGEEKKQRKQKKSGHKFYAFVVLFLGIMIVVMTVLLLFHVQTIRIVGNEYVESREIASDIQRDRYTKNSLYLMGKNLMGKFTFPEAVESVKVRMKAPWSIEITVKEKKMAAYTIIGDEYVYFDKEGLVLYKSEMIVEGVPYVEGISAAEAILYKKLEAEPRLFRNISEALQAFKKYKVAPERIVSNGVGLRIYIGNICVDLGSGDMDLKITQIPPILNKLEGKTGTIDLRHYNEASEIITFKEGEMPETGEES